MKPKFQRIPDHPGGVTCLGDVTLHGVDYSSGDHIPAKVWQATPEKNRLAYFRLGKVTEDPGDIDEAESALQTQRRTALDEAASVRDLLSRILADLSIAEQAVTDLEKAHRSNALADYKTTKGKGSTRTPQLTSARDHRDSLTAAKLQAGEDIARLEKEAEKLARLAEFARGRRIMEKRRAVCVELQAGIEGLAPLFTAYHGLAAQFKALLRDTGAQICSQWRIENLIDEKLLGRAISRDLRVLDLAALDTKIFEGVLDRAMKELNNG